MTPFDYLKQKIDIFDVVSSYVSLKKLGSYWKGPCPFHSETDASFTISPERQMFYCFGCCKGGDVVSFISEIEKVSQHEALKFLAEKNNLEIPSEIFEKSGFSKASAELKTEKELYLKLCQKISDWCFNSLKNSAQAFEYLNSRGIEEKNINDFKVGYFPKSSALQKKFILSLAKDGILFESLEKYGFFSQKAGGFYSPFQDRIIFPIFDQLSRCVGFGGRVFRPEDSRAKYYNSKESEFFLKKKVLFGINSAKLSMSKKKEAYLVEGYMDCVFMQKAGYKNTVATLGTSLSWDHLDILKKIITKLFVVFDGDSAGQKAVIRLVKNGLGSDVSIDVISLPKGEDPASILKKDSTLDPFFSRKENIFKFFISRLGEDFFKLSSFEKVKRLETILEPVFSISNEIKRLIILKEVSGITGLSVKNLVNFFKKSGKKDKFEKNNEKKVRIKPDIFSFDLEKAVFFIYLVALEKKFNFVSLKGIALNIFKKQTRDVLEFAFKLEDKKEDFYLSKIENIVSKDFFDEIKSGVMRFESCCEKEYFNQLLARLFAKFKSEQMKSLKAKIFCKKINKIEIEEVLGKIGKINKFFKERGVL